MKKVDLGQTIGILANIGVLIGILLLVYELNQNREMMVAQTRNDIVQSLTTMLHNEATSTDLPRISVKVAQGEPLSPEETERFYLNWQAYFALWENVYFQYQSGLFSEEEYLGRRAAWGRILGRRAVFELWCSRRNERAAQFAANMDELLVDRTCD